MQRYEYVGSIESIDIIHDKEANWFMVYLKQQVANKMQVRLFLYVVENGKIVPNCGIDKISPTLAKEVKATIASFVNNKRKN